MSAAGTGTGIASSTSPLAPLCSTAMSSLAAVAAPPCCSGDVASGRLTRLNPSGIVKRSRSNDVEKRKAVAAVVAFPPTSPTFPVTNQTPSVTPHQVFAVLMKCTSRR